MERKRKKKARAYGSSKVTGLARKPFKVSYEAPSGSLTGGFTLSTHTRMPGAERDAKRASKNRSGLRACVIHRPTNSVIACYLRGRKIR